MILPVRHNQIQDGCQIDPHGTLFHHFNIYNFLLDKICFQKNLVSLNIPGGAREAPISTRLIQTLENIYLSFDNPYWTVSCNESPT